MAGTSPRMRGKLMGGVPAVQCMRNIPAYAGKTPQWRKLRGHRPEHPRVCGENLPRALPHVMKLGTSPRMRGKHSSSPRKGDIGRNIPAYAGKTKHYPRQVWGFSEHPRVCGENNTQASLDAIKGGTSPRMRGKPNPVDNVLQKIRNIPAYAGKTCIFISSSSGISGTSPRMRGKPGQWGRLPEPYRNIPAYAGKT